MRIEQAVAVAAQAVARISAEVERVVIGQRSAIELSLAAMLTGGHVLLEALPGTGKTTLAKALATVVGGTTQRLQCTPDLLPGDVTGVGVFNPATLQFEFRPGPVFANILHADEINRATPKAQSALLEAMAENQVTIDAVSHQLPTPFLVIATQNPIEMAGTYELPEAQLDRFSVRVRMGYPDHNAALRVLSTHRSAPPQLQQVISLDDITRIGRLCENIWIDDQVAAYIVAIVEQTRSHPDIVIGASPRATIALARIAAALAMCATRAYVSIDDVKRAAAPVLAHRLVLQTKAERQGNTAELVIEEILQRLSVPPR
jgi:MoxR-like ATPase